MFGPPFTIRAEIVGRVRSSAFGVDGFPLLWLANLAWNVGRWMEQVAIGWIAFELTQSALLVALIGFYCSPPLFLVGVYGGVLGDRYDRRRLILLLQGVNLLTVSVLATLPLLGQLTYADHSPQEL